MAYGMDSRITLLKHETPLQELKNLEQELETNCCICMKRDDLTDVALSGNKIRKLEYLAWDALQQGATTLLTFGGPQTNHGRLTTGVARMLGLKPVLILDGACPDYFSGNQVLDLFMDADIYFVADRDPAEVAEEVTRAYERAGEKVYQIPVGGSNAIGSMGYVRFMGKLKEQLAEQGLKADHLFAGAGSMGMLGGMVLGAKVHDMDLKVHGVPVSSRPAEHYIENGLAITSEAIEKYHLDVAPLSADDFIIEVGPEDAPFYGAGYNIPDTATQDAIALLAQTEAIFVDPCYTGKVFRGMVECIRNGKIKDGETVVMLHSGGIPGLWSKVHLDALQERFFKRYKVSPVTGVDKTSS